MSDHCIESAIVCDPQGMHARPAVKISKLAKRFVADVELSSTNGDAWINAKSTNAVMKLKAVTGTELMVRAKGEDATAAVSTIIELVKRAFED